MRETLRQALRGHEVTVASGPEQALALLRDDPHDLLLTDVDMPEGGGRRLVRDAVGLDPRLAVVVVSGAGTAEDAAEFHRLGAVDYVMKPIANALLGAAVARALEMR